MNTKQTAWLKIEAQSRGADLMAWAAEMGESWIILESYTGIVFERWNGQTLGAEFAGRIFSESAEIRWRREAEDLQSWRYSETPAGQGTEYEVEERKYFAWGEWLDGICWEPRLPRPVEYPVKGKSGRCYFWVREYRRLWPEQGTWPLELDKVEELLNMPRLSAYRLAGFGTQGVEE
jgi:hypothetical protein